MTAETKREFDTSSVAESPSQSRVLEPGDPRRHRPDDCKPELTGSVSGVRFEEAQVRASDSNGIVVYRRNKRQKTADSTNGNSSGKVVNMDETEGNSGIHVLDSDVMEVEVKEESRIRRFTRLALEQKKIEQIPNGKSEGEVEERSCGVNMSGRKLEMKMSKKISITERPTTVRELFETGLLEGYPVFYNGGKKGIPLRGTIKDTGILCSCDLCNGTRVVPPSKFEIHACNSYRRASEYICLENGKSLLDVVKECKKGSLKTLEETIQSIIGPVPVKKNLICPNCKGSFVATLAGKDEQLCDSCIISLRPEATPTKSINTENGAMVMHSSRVSPSVHTLSRKKRLMQPAVAPKSAGTATVCSSFGNNMQDNISKKLSKSIAVSKYSKIALPGVSVHSRTQWKMTKRDQKMHKLVFDEGGLPDGTEVAYYSRGKKLLVGYKKGSGIFCSCCNIEVSPSQFEAHAGWASRKKPYGYIYTSNGVSLHEFAISLLKGRKSSVKDSDDLCIICADGGKLVLCDGCPRAFHKVCASLPAIPRGKWYCKYCESMLQREKFVERNENALAAGRVSGTDPIEQITKRCIRIVKNAEEAEFIACVLCRGYDFSKSGFGPRTVILCDQCEKEYHVGCLKRSKIADLKELPKGKWFCSKNCNKIYSALQSLLTSGEERLPDSCLDAIRVKEKENRLAAVGELDVRWRLLSGRICSRETRRLLAEAVSIFHDCFDPIVDSVTGRDFIPSMVYGRNIRGQDFGGMYCAILTVNSTVVSAGILRIFGQDRAELPIVATRVGSQGKGYFQLLFSCIEKLLSFLGVRSFVLPAAVEAMSIWTEKFGFQELTPDQLVRYRRTCWQMISFKGTSMLEKSVSRCRIIQQREAENDVPDE
ncbi:uncharacterized protein LOC107831397 isoform X2 [Nicotiana tabacum]|uniref:Uncharacterized protein LOC107831397 isoform X2 n=2 Tax=Nicotiana TaxID=4085 RepID=A0A1S4DMJ1_TOBAC|nr:PREDICTED: uncharacterized protein LOC104243390 isoform X2 [Nicotiana sylvestris]XP_016514647.1 PREDICTED: uncharacterized protein LOC107831397 isoform X2 [Nicotiana tabacum]